MNELNQLFDNRLFSVLPIVIIIASMIFGKILWIFIDVLNRRSQMKHYMIVFGTRLELIKMYPVIKECQNHAKKIKLTIVNTGQQKEMVDMLLSEWGIKPHYDLNVMKQKQSLTELNINLMSGLEPIMKIENPDLVVVHGDTTTAFIASLVAFYQQKKIAHVEAGLRTNDKYAPFTADVNRQMIDRVTDYYFVPTQKNKENLEKEGIYSKIEITGNTGIDTLNFHDLNQTITHDQRQIMVTMYQREWNDEKLKRICAVLVKIAKENPEVVIKYPEPLNPKGRKMVERLLSDQENIFLTKPLNHLELQKEMMNSFIVITDSSGVQEEASDYDVPVLVVRDGTGEEKLYKNIVSLLEDQAQYETMGVTDAGAGKAAKRIVDHLLQEV